MKVIENNGLSFKGETSFEVLENIEKAKALCEKFDIVACGSYNYKVNLVINKGSNIYNTQIILMTDNNESIAWYYNGKFWYFTREVEFIR